MPANSTAERVRADAGVRRPGRADAGRGRAWSCITTSRTRVAKGGYRMLDQFANPDNWRAHVETTGPEIWADTKGEITHFVSAMGTTGTIMGVSRFLKSQDERVQIVGCQPTEGSRIPGIRRWPREYLPKIFEPERVDRVVDVEQDDAERKARELAAKTGLFVGVSAAGAVWAAQKVASEIAGGVIVCILCDRGDRYLSSDLYAPDHATLGDEGLGGLEIVE
ncbi:MAG: pyridoxal-phosphate dependent enzyme [Polyangiales bacterium]